MNNQLAELMIHLVGDSSNNLKLKRETKCFDSSVLLIALLGRRILIKLKFVSNLTFSPNLIASLISKATQGTTFLLYCRFPLNKQADSTQLALIARLQALSFK